MAELVIPTIPAQPAEGATWQEWDIWLRRVALANDAILRQRQAAASEAHGAAQAATAQALQASVSAQEALAQAMSLPAPRSLPFRAELVWQCMQDMPQSTKDTDTAQVVAAMARVDAYLAKVPNGAAP